MTFQGSVEAIHLAAEPGSSPMAVAEALAEAGLGLRGDRYFGRPKKDGSPEPEAALTLIEAESLEALSALQVAAGRDPLAPGASRRNVTTRGVPLNHLVGRLFRVGGVLCRGFELCEPCRHLEALTVPGVRTGLVHRGGLRGWILEGGVIRVGDAITPVDAA